MVGDIFQPTHLLFVLVVALLVLGPKRLPEVGRTLGAGIRDFRQAISGETPDPPQRQQTEQVETPSEPYHQPAVPPDEITWPEEAVGPSSFDEPVEAASAEPATAVVTDTEPATEVVSDLEPATTVDASTHGADSGQLSDLDALYFQAPADEATPVADTSDSAESHTGQHS
jgi:sec-independent protein translocase protein TatA